MFQPRLVNVEPMGHLFQSTLLMWGAASWDVILMVVVSHFNPRSRHGKQRGAKGRPKTTLNFNPRTPAGYSGHHHHVVF